MRYEITSAQISHFHKEHTLHLEGLYRLEEIEQLKERVASEPFDWDTHRTNAPLLAALRASRLGQVASKLFGEKKLRIAFSQKMAYPQVTLSLKEMSSLSDTCGGCLIDLDSGALTFYDNEIPIDFGQFGPATFFIAFATDKARYQFQEKAPHPHLLKKLGYGFGDKISHDTHPLICQ